MIRVGVFGASGYMGGEALRVLSEHPEVEVLWATSRSGKTLDEVHRNFAGAELKFIAPEKVTPCDVVFVAAPSGVAMEIAEKFLKQGTKIIDLGADFRLKDRGNWERLYGKKHSQWKTAEEAVYGIPELYRKEIAKARVVANPGCYSSAVILGLAPLLQESLVEADCVTVTGISGTAGAGADLDPALHHPEIGNNVVAYNVVDHRHTYEMEQELSAIAKSDVTVHFTPCYVPITRGILTISSVFPKKAITREKVISLYKDFYKSEHFIQVLDTKIDPKATWQTAPYPWVAAVSGTNFCQIGIDTDPVRGRIVVFTTLDSLGKGGAHAGVQNMNILCGLPERTGLERRGLHPY